MTEALLEALDRFWERFGSEQLMFDLAEPSLENLVTWWFSDLSEEQIHVLTLRYGIQGDPVPVEEIAHLMGNTPRKVVAIEARALQKVRQRRHRLFLDPIAESLRREIYRRGGLVTESDLASALQNLYPSEEICPIGVARLVMHVYDDFARIPGEDAWGLVGYPLSLVPIVRSFLGGIGAESAEPIAFERLWQQMRQYREQLAEPLPDDFLRACIQTDRRIEIARDGLCWVHADEEAPQPSWKEPSLDLLVEAWLGSQSDRHRQVIWSRYGLGDGRERTLEECGQIMGVTGEGVR
ncbi:MAG: hypothetical protein ONB06_05185, partial [candidate division KSB1 bacterium]|nr:hypothetical protein [candidate division KSB1 bacterium]